MFACCCAEDLSITRTLKLKPEWVSDLQQFNSLDQKVCTAATLMKRRLDFLIGAKTDRDRDALLFLVREQAFSSHIDD